MDINTTLPLKTDKVQWPTTTTVTVRKRRKKKYKTRYSKDDNDNNLFDLDAININRNELLIWGKASLSLDAYLQKRYSESLETIIPPNMRPSHMRLYAHETYIDMITKLQNDIHNNKSFYNNINVIKVSDMMKRPLLHGEQIISIIDGVVRKIRFCAIELIDKFLRTSIKPLYTLCREAAILSEHIIYEIRKIIEEVLLALINIYRSVGHLNLEKVVYLGEIESLSKLLTTVCNSGEETEDEKSIKRELDDNDNEIKNNKTNNNENANNNDLVAELVERFGIPAEDVDAILQKYSYSRRNQKKKRQKPKEKTFVTAVNELKKVDEGDKEDDNSDNDNENEDESDEESNIESDDDEDEDENEHMSRVSESLVDESMHMQVNFEQTLLHLGEESQKYQIGLANAVKQSRLDKTEEARKTFLGGHKLLKDLNIETEEVIKLRKQVDNINRMHIATLEQQIKIMQSQLEKVKESILTPKEKEILRLKKMERELEQHVHDWVTKHKDHHGRILRRNLLLYYLKYR
jgi:phage gp36-like protein